MAEFASDDGRYSPVILRAFTQRRRVDRDACECSPDVVRRVGWPEVTGRLHAATCPVTNAALKDVSDASA